MSSAEHAPGAQAASGYTKLAAFTRLRINALTVKPSISGAKFFADLEDSDEFPLPGKDEAAKSKPDEPDKSIAVKPKAKKLSKTRRKGSESGLGFLG